MSWLRIDDRMMTHPKIVHLTDRQFRVWMRVLSYCSQVEDPTIDEHVIRDVSGLTSKGVATYVRLGLLDVVSGSVFVVHDWADYRPKDSSGAERQARWRAKRRHGRNGSGNAERNDESVTGDVTDGVTNPRARTRVPVPVSTSQAGRAELATPPGPACLPADEQDTGFERVDADAMLGLVGYEPPPPRRMHPDDEGIFG